MGNFSRDTFDKLKHYVGVRLQQGVPLVDADWNEQEDIRKHELRTFLKWFVGDGVPKNNDGFHILMAAWQDNDFIIKGGTPGDPGRCLVDGWDVVNENDMRYSEQALYNDSTLAAAWGVSALPPISPPSSANRVDLVYLDVWERMVGAPEDPDLVHPDIALETCVRLKREWVVRVGEGQNTLPPAPAGHVFYPLAVLSRVPGKNTIEQSDLTDFRKTGLGLLFDIINVRDGNLCIGTDSHESAGVNIREMENPYALRLNNNSDAPNQYGVHASSNGNSGTKFGVYGHAGGSGYYNFGVYGVADAVSNINYAVSGQSHGNEDLPKWGLVGMATGDNGNRFGASVSASGNGGNSYGVNAYAYGTTGMKYGVYSRTLGDEDEKYGVYTSAVGIRGAKYGVQSIADGEYGGKFGIHITAKGRVDLKYGVYASAEGDENSKYGLYGRAFGKRGSKFGAYAIADGEEGDKFGLHGNAVGVDGNKYGVRAYASGVLGVKYGVYASAEGDEDSKFGLWGYAYGVRGTKYGVYASAGGGGTNYAGFFNGNVHVQGTLSKGAGSFLIDHPKDPMNKTLRHNFVESPENLCLYRGKVKLDDTGAATVKMPPYFTELTNEEEATVTLTAIGRKPFMASYIWKKSFKSFKIFGEPDREVAYIVLADRDDPVARQFKRPVEEQKGNGNFEKGKLLYPEAFGKPREMGVHHDMDRRAFKEKREKDMPPEPVEHFQPPEPPPPEMPEMPMPPEPPGKDLK